MLTNDDILKQARGGGERYMFGRKEDKKELTQEDKEELEPTRPSSEIEELKELLLTESNVTDTIGILQLAKTQLTGDVQQRKIGRAIEILENL